MSLSKDELLHRVEDYIEIGDKPDVFENDCDIIEFLLDNCEIEIPEKNRFFVNVNCAGIQETVVKKRSKRFSSLNKTAGLSDGIAVLAYTGTYDFGHTNAEWESIIPLGIYGLRSRVEKYKAMNVEHASFYNNVLRVYDAALRFMRRAADAARLCGKSEMADGLVRLCEGSPANLFEALQTSTVYYTLQQFFDGTNLRTLGRLDKLFYPYYKNEEKESARRMLFDYVKEIDSWGAVANIPFAISGTDEFSNDLTNELSYTLLDIYNESESFNVKLHVLCSEKTPDALIEKAFSCIRDGNNSIVFMSDEKVIESLLKNGAERSDACNYHIVGCYECGAEGELTCSCNARVNIPKAIELALCGGRDMMTGKLVGLENSGTFETYEELQLEFERQLGYLCAQAMKATDLQEINSKKMHSTPILSSTYTSALEKGGDLYCDFAAKYNNSSLNALGLATAADSLFAIKKAVFEDKTVSLGEFTEILRSNWKDNEYLRLLIKNKYSKYGQGNAENDDIAKRIVDVISDAVSYKPNAKGGIWRLGLFSIDWRWGFGKKTAASADGRFAGEPISQNTGAGFGTDKEGATAHLISAARIDASKTPNGAIVDIDLHSSAVRGENGIKALVASLKTYFELGGFAVHYNVLDTKILIDAKKNPEKYPTLQVRLCGWNVLFSSLSEKEKDEFIARSMK